jgi:hypothetical protein
VSPTTAKTRAPSRQVGICWRGALDCFFCGTPMASSNGLGQWDRLGMFVCVFLRAQLAVEAP